RAPDPLGGATGLGPSGGVAGGGGPQAERQVSGPRRGGGHRVTRHNHMDRLAGQRASGHQASGHLARQRARVIWQGSGLRVNWYMTAGHWVRHWIVLAGQRALGHQASGHLARQRAPRHLARQWARVNRHGDSEHRVIRYWIVWVDSGHRSPGLIGSSGWISSSCWVEASG
ncbi:unnamed protein product, partial [Staurois parvus]